MLETSVYARTAPLTARQSLFYFNAVSAGVTNNAKVKKKRVRENNFLGTFFCRDTKQNDSKDFQDLLLMHLTDSST